MYIHLDISVNLCPSIVKFTTKFFFKKLDSTKGTSLAFIVYDSKDVMFENSFTNLE
jgi:hypothetical protein